MTLKRLQLNNVNKIYKNGVHSIKSLNLDIEDREFIVIVGPSGCGKTTLLRMIAGLEEVTSGDLYISGIRANNIEPNKRDIAMVFQNCALYPHMTVYENLAFGLKMKKEKPSKIEEKVMAASHILDIEELLQRKPDQISGGQRQRVALGRAIVREPQVFLMDEPLSSLDAKLRVQMRAEIIKLHKRLNATFVYVTHDQTEAMTMGSRIIVMRDGLIQQNDTPRNIYNDPSNIFVASFIGSPQINLVEAKVVEDKSEIKLIFKEGMLFLHKEQQKILKDKEYVGKSIVLGVRAENVSFEIPPVEMKPLTGCVEFTELLGSETLVYINTQVGSVVGKMPADYDIEVGKYVKIYFNSSNVNLFDKETELRII
ncbi:MAG: sn-glycerol-3-phosphate ABC transporter ATP-binding protein UgpC [Aminobacterium sp.]|nr:sn-glycerol-3-phosphate ABC transporter ATP-binding protein UgpC [Aminobacterium sp.]MEA4878469.1 sn-glycerol-3-phosphate ABC transporter ATP-binding protein UgpC [Aminobacterium sp.]